MHADMNAVRAVASRSLRDRLGSYFAARRAYRDGQRDLARLLGVGDHILRDIGVTRDEVFRLRQVPFRDFTF